MRRLSVFLFAIACAFQMFAVKVGVVLPFKDRSPIGQTSIEFYRGFLLAVDSIKRQGLSVEVYAIDSGTSDATLSAALAKGDLKGADMVFGPAVETQANTLATYCKQNGIRLVMPFGMRCQQIDSNPYIFQASVPQENLYPRVMQMLLKNQKGANYVMLKCNDYSQEGEAFQTFCEQQVTGNGLHCSILNVNADDIAAQESFSTKRNNVIVPDSHSENALLTLLIFLRQYPQYRFTLIGFPSWLNIAGRYENEFYAYDTYIFSPYFYTPLSNKMKKFDWSYNKNFNVYPSHTFPSPALLGFDVAYYFLAGEAPEPYQQDLKFGKASEQGGQVNNSVQLVHYATNKTVSVIK